jgi:signal transduction histidine kinase
VVHLGRGRRFTSVCVEEAESLASLAATALQNAGLFQQTLREKERATHVLAQLKAVLKEVDAGVLLVNDRQQVLWMNRQFGVMFGIDDVEAIMGSDTPAPMSALRDRARACFADPDAFFAQRDRIDADREFAGYLGNLEIIHPQARTLQEYTTPIHDSRRNYIGRLWVYHDITAQQRSEEALRRSEAQHRAILRALPDAVFRLGRDGTYLDYIAPDDFAMLLPAEKFLGHSVAELLPADLARQSLEGIGRALSSRQVQTLNYQMLLEAGVRDYEARIVACGRDEVLAIVRDVTEKNFLEAQFLQSQKLDSLGRLAGGIAHDFNNLLGGIMGYASLLKGKLDPASDAYDFANIIEKATQRGARLTQQLLTAARKSPFDPRPMDVTEVMREIVQIMAHALPKNINVVTRLNAGLPAVQGDPTQLHQVLMNLCVNGADAMPEGGTLTLSNGEVFLDEAFCQKHVSLRPGPYVQLVVADTGMGISEADQSKIFDPFFTTKGPGKGTGLGLAVVYAIVKNHQGLIEVTSKLSQGSTFTVYLPVHRPEPN